MTPAEQRRAWAYPYIRRVSEPPPAYGSADWLALPEDPRRIAAVVIAAEKWAFDGDTIEMRLRAELEADRWALKHEEDAGYRARRDQHGEFWTGSGFRRDPRIALEVDRRWQQWIDGGAA